MKSLFDIPGVKNIGFGFYQCKKCYMVFVDARRKRCPLCGSSNIKKIRRF